MSFFYLTQTEQKTTFSKEKAINCFIIASAYVGARAMCQGQLYGYSASGPVLNPAIALGTTLVMLVNQASLCVHIWLFALVPFGGAVVAVLFHEFVFKKTHEVLEAEGDDDDNDTLIEK